MFRTGMKYGLGFDRMLGIGVLKGGLKCHMSFGVRSLSGVYEFEWIVFACGNVSLWFFIVWRSFKRSQEALSLV